MIQWSVGSLVLKMRLSFDITLNCGGVFFLLFSVDNQLIYAQAQLNKLKKTNVFNTTFHIWYYIEILVISLVIPISCI